MEGKGGFLQSGDLRINIAASNQSEHRQAQQHHDLFLQIQCDTKGIKVDSIFHLHIYVLTNKDNHA